MSTEERRERLWLKRLERDARRHPNLAVIPGITGFPDANRNELAEIYPDRVTHTRVNAGISGTGDIGGTNETWATCKFRVPAGISAGRIFGAGFSPYNKYDKVSYSIYPIIADYDVDTLTWNTRGDLTIGAAVFSITGGKEAPTITHAQITLDALTFGLLLKPGTSTGDGTHPFELEYYWDDI